MPSFGAISELPISALPVVSSGGNSQSIVITLDGVTVAISQNLEHSQALAITLDGVSAAISQTLEHSQALAITLDGIVATINQSVGAGNSQALAITLDDVSASINQSLRHSQSIGFALDDVTVLINQSVAGAGNSQALAITLDDISVEIQQSGPALATTGGGVPWNPYRATGETEAQKETRRIAQGIIQRAKQPQADIPALFEEAREVSASIKADIARIEFDIQGLLSLIDKRQTKLRLDALRKSQNDALAMRQMEMALIDLQLRAEAQAQQIEELDIVFMVVMLAAM